MAGGVACVRGVLGDAAEALTDDEISQTLDDLQRRARRRQRQQPLDSLEQALFDEAEEIASEMEAAGQVQRWHAALNERIHTSQVAFAEAFNSADPSMGVEARNVGVNFARQGGRISVDARSMALEGRLLDEMVGDLRREGLLEFMTRRSGDIRSWLVGEGEGPLDRLIARELWEIGRDGGQPGVSGSREARRIAEIINTYQEAARQLQNRAGAVIRRMPGYIVRQSHDQAKIRQAGYEAWRDEILPRLDVDRTFDGADPEQFLRGVWEGLSSGVHHQSSDAPLIGFRGPANLGKRVSQERVLHFASADDWYDYNQRFGVGALMNAVMLGQRRAAQDIALMEVWGPNPRAMFDRVRQTLRERHRADPEKLARLNRPQLDHQFAEIDGTTRIPGDVRLARIGSNVRGGQTLSKLGGVTLSAMGDIPLMASEARYQGRGLLSGYGTSIDNLMQGRRGGDQRRIADIYGVGLDGMKGDIQARFASEDGPPGTMSRLIQLFFKLNFLSWWTDSHKTGIGLMMARGLALDAPLGWAELSPQRQRLLSLYEISQDDWNLLRRNAVQQADDGVAYMTPDLVRQIANDSLPEGSTRQRQRVRDELETKLRAMVADRVDFAVLTPGARERAALNRGTAVGTAEGEAYRAMTQFKSFPLSVVSKPIGRDLQAAGVGTGRLLGRQGSLAQTFTPFFSRGRGDMLGLAHMIVAMTVFGFLAMSLKDIAKGRSPRDPEDEATWRAAFLQGGGAGIYGDFFFGEFNRFGGGLFATTLGPTAGSAEDLARLFTEARQGDPDAASAFRFIQNHTPGVNLFYTRMALDYLILYQIQEMLSPGSLRRMERGVRERNAQTFMSPPSQAIPYGGGDRVFEGVRG